MTENKSKKQNIVYCAELCDYPDNISSEFNDWMDNNNVTFISSNTILVDNLAYMYVFYTRDDDNS